MVVHTHYAHCEDVKPLLDLPNDFEFDDGELVFKFEFNQDDVHGKDGEILDVLSVSNTYGFRVDIKDLVNNEILEELLEEDDLIINLKLLIDPDILKSWFGSHLVELARREFIDTNNLFVNNSVERLTKDIFSQTFNLFQTDGAMNIFVHLDVANKHYYDDTQEYHLGYTQAVLRKTRLRRRNQPIDRFRSDEELIQFVQRVSMEMELPKKLIGASRTSIDALETTKYMSKECKEVSCCSVCYEEFMTDEEIKKMPCSSAHIFHTDCIEKWLKINHVCPVCRYQIPTDE